MEVPRNSSGEWSGVAVKSEDQLTRVPYHTLYKNRHGKENKGERSESKKTIMITGEQFPSPSRLPPTARIEVWERRRLQSRIGVGPICTASSSFRLSKTTLVGSCNFLENTFGLIWNSQIFLISVMILFYICHLSARE